MFNAGMVDVDVDADAARAAIKGQLAGFRHEVVALRQNNGGGRRRPRGRYSSARASDARV